MPVISALDDPPCEFLRSAVLRILTLTTIFPHANHATSGSFVERQVLTLAERPGVEVRVIAPIRVSAPPFHKLPRHRPMRDLPRQEQWKGLTVYRPRFRVLPKIGGPWAGDSLVRALRPLLKNIRAEFPFDVIDAQFFWPDGVAAARLGRELGVPVSVKARGSDIDYFAHGRLIGPQLVKASREADALLSVSEALRKRMIAVGMPGEKIAVHYTGIDNKLFRPADRATAKAALGLSGPVLATVGRLLPFKGQRVALAALRQLPHATLLIVGTGPDLRPLERLAARAGLRDRVRFMGEQPRDALPTILAAADVMVLPSQREGLANVWLEALACGTPIVVAETEAAYEVIGRRECGRIVPRQPDAIAQAVSDMLSFPPDAETVRASTTGFSWERNSEELFEHLCKLGRGSNGTTARPL